MNIGKFMCCKIITYLNIYTLYYNMLKRISFVISDKNFTKAKKIQGRMIPENDSNVSLSYVLNMLIEAGAKKY